MSVENGWEGHWDRKTGERTEWLPVCLVALGVRLGVQRNGVWLAEKRGELHALKTLKYVPALPLLERNRSSALNEMRQKIQASSVDSLEVYFLSAARLIEAALQSGMDYWADSGLGWLEPSDLDPGLLEALRSLQDADWASESVKSRAKRFGRIAVTSLEK